MSLLKAPNLSGFSFCSSFLQSLPSVLAPFKPIATTLILALATTQPQALLPKLQLLLL